MKQSKASTKAFTLVELLVVIGIIALLISILLPALSEARDQANLVACQSVERQFYNSWQNYANDYRGWAMPCVFKKVDPTAGDQEFDWFEAFFLGAELNKAKGKYDAGGHDRDLATADVIKTALTCPAAFHESDPNPSDIINGKMTRLYYGDYIYNRWMGYFDPGQVPQFARPYLKLTQIPGNVVILVESMKPNIMNAGTTSAVTANDPEGVAYKSYFEKYTELFNSKDPTKLNRMGRPHLKNKKLNALSADGHVSTIDPNKDFYLPTASGGPPTHKDFREYLIWNDGRKTDGGGNPAYVHWDKNMPGL